MWVGCIWCVWGSTFGEIKSGTSLGNFGVRVEPIFPFLRGRGRGDSPKRGIQGAPIPATVNDRTLQLL